MFINNSMLRLMFKVFIEVFFSVWFMNIRGGFDG